MIGDPTLDWYLDDDALRRRPEMVSPGTTQRVPVLSRRQRVLLTSLLLALAVGISIATVARTLVQRELDQVREEIGAVAEAEGWAWARGDYALAGRLVDAQARPDWIRWHAQQQEGSRRWARAAAQRPIVSIESIEFLDSDRVLAALSFAREEVPSDLRQMEHRIYRRTAGGWQRTATDVALWGDMESREVGRFRIEYGRRDRTAVEGLIASLPEMDRRLHGWLGLQLSEEDTLVLRVQAENIGVTTSFTGRELVLLSPELSRSVQGYGVDLTLSLPVATALAERTVDQVPGLTPRFQWVMLFAAGRAWLAHAANPLLAAEPFPVDLAPLRQRIASHDLPSLSDLHETRSVENSWSSAWSRVAAQTVVAYAVSQYGEEVVDDLLWGTVHHESWETFCQDVFRVSAAQFQHGWQRYLRARLAKPI